VGVRDYFYIYESPASEDEEQHGERGRRSPEERYIYLLRRKKRKMEKGMLKGQANRGTF